MIKDQGDSPLVTVIVPVYNTADYLEQCLDSIVGQTYRNLEIILVDDGSTDGSGQICDRYAAADPRVRAIHKANGGQSSARNVALDEMQGEWVLFVDSDDWIELDAVETLLSLKSDGAELVEFGIRHVRENGSEITLNEPCLLSGKDALRLLVHVDNYRGMMANKLFKSSVISDLRFIEGRYHEDTPFIVECLYRVNQYQYIAKALYNYRRDREGQTTQGFTDRRLDLFRNFECLINKYAGSDLSRYFETVYLYWVKSNYFEAYIFPIEERNRVMKMLSPYLQKAKKMHPILLDWKTSLSWRAFYTSPRAYAFLVVHVQPVVRRILGIHRYQ